MSFHRPIFVSYAADISPQSPRAVDLHVLSRDLDIEFIGRHESHQQSLIPRDVASASVSLVLVDEHTPRSRDVAHDIGQCLKFGVGLVGLSVGDVLVIPEMLTVVGAEVLDWHDKGDVNYLPTALEKARRGAIDLERARKLGTGTGATCVRPSPSPQG